MKNISVKLFLNQGDVFFKDIPIFGSGGHFVQQSGIICALLVEGIVVRIISVKLWSNSVSCSLDAV